MRNARVISYWSEGYRSVSLHKRGAISVGNSDVLIAGYTTLKTEEMQEGSLVKD